MPSKTEEYLALAQRTANGLTRYWESWTDYLTTASRLYKYPFADQLMIYAQRPDATACADFDIWNNRMNRYVRRGAKGIALLDESSGFPRLHYVFDVSDTGVRRNSRDPEVWQLNDDLFQPVSEMLAQEYGIHHERLSQQIADIAGKLAESYWDNNSTDILAIVDGSFLMDYDDQLSVIEKKPYRERQKRITYPPKESNRDRLCSVIDEILQQKPTDYEDFLQKLEQQGYEIKRGKYTSVKGARQKRFIRLKTLGAGYSEDEIKAVIAGKAEHRPHQKQPPKEQPFQLLVDIQAKLAEGKGGGYERWAKKYNLKEMSKTLIFLQEQKIGSADDLKERADAALSRYHKLGDSIKAAEKRMAEIAVLRAHIVNYAKTRPVYDAYRKSGYSSKFLEAHREEVTLHKTAKAAFNESGLKKLPKVKDLNAEYSALLTKKKALYPEYRKTRDEMQEIVKAQKNVELFFAEEKDSKQVEQIR